MNSVLVRGLLGGLLVTLLNSCADNKPVIDVEEELASLQKSFLSQFESIPDANELPEDATREFVAYIDMAVVPVITARAETAPVESTEDAADDPAIWIHPTNPEKSLLLGTDKKAGLAIYDFSGNLLQFVPAGLPNNVDLRQNLEVGTWHGDLAVTSNRADNSVTLFSVDETGAHLMGAFPVDEEPYGICIGKVESVATVFVTYKTGIVKAHQFESILPAVVAREVGSLRFSSQLEGCVHQDNSSVLFVGEENKAIWRVKTIVGSTEFEFGVANQVDIVGNATGLVSDVEGVALYDNGLQQYLIASSQGNDSYAVYRGIPPHAFLGRFRIGTDPSSGIDGSQETDGLAASGQPLGEKYPDGVLVVQDGFNAPAGSTQNFKIIDWRDVTRALRL